MTGTSDPRTRLSAATGLPLLLSLLAASATLTACGGGGGGGSGSQARFVTADPRGMTTGGQNSALAAGAPAPGAASAQAEGDVARTIEEGDLYRVAGDTLYLLNTFRGLTIVDLSTVTVLGRLPLVGYPHEMYVKGGRALVFVSGADGNASLVDVSVANPAAPSETTRVALGGPFRASRLVGDTLCAVTEGEVRLFDVSGALAPAGAATLPNPAAFVTATDTLLAVAGWSDWSGTPLTFVDISNPAGPPVVRGTIDVPGWVADEKKLSLAGTVLRIVSHDWADEMLSRLTTIDASDPDAPSVLAVLPIVKGEQLFATRFTDDAAYVVTFEQVDPLWVIDLSNPAAPAIAGSVTVPGWSTHLVPTGDGRLVGLGVEPSTWSMVVSLFDVTNPALPVLSDRLDFGWGWSYAFKDEKALGVFASGGLVLVPVGGDSNGIAVIDLGASTLTLRGVVSMDGQAQRGFPHPRGIVGISTEQVVVANPTTLAAVGSATIAENVVDACRLPDGDLLELVAKSGGGKLGQVALPMVPERLYPFGFQVAVVGWDDLGRACYVVDFGGAAPVLSSRFDLGGSWFLLGDPGWGMMRPDVWGGGGYASSDAVLTDDGHLCVHGLPVVPTGPWMGGWEGNDKGMGGGMGIWMGGMTGGGGSGSGVPGMMGGANAPGFAPPAPGDLSPTGPLDGFVVVDVANSTLDAPIEVADEFVTGFVADDGGDLVYTAGDGAPFDGQGRPQMRHDLVRVHVADRATTTAVNVPGYVVSAAGDNVYTADETWTEGWAWQTSVLAISIGPTPDNSVTVLDRLVLPDGAYDLRAAGATLFFTKTTWAQGPPVLAPDPVVTADPAVPNMGWANPGYLEPWLPTTAIGTVRLGSTLALGPSVDGGEHWLSLVLPEDGSVLLLSDGVSIERWDFSGASASLLWSKDVGSGPVSVRPDPATPGSYFLALGYAGLDTAP